MLIFLNIVLQVVVKELKKIVIIEKNCDNWKRLQKKKKNHVSNRMKLVVM